MTSTVPQVQTPINNIIIITHFRKECKYYEQQKIK
nr:MAG TPA: hypothetical protein [Caudoviricetes sp.]